MDTLTLPDAPPVNGVESDPAPAPVVLTARALLDRAKDAADTRSPDGLYTVTIPAWGADVTVRMLNYATLTRIQAECGAGTEAADPAKAVRMTLHESLADPPFSPKEIDEIMDDPAQLEAALILSQAMEQINKLGARGQASAARSFRAGSHRAV